MSDDIQLAQLRAFEAVSRLHSYAVPAEELSYSAPGVYLQIKSLEKALGLRLVRRDRKQVMLTSEGQELLPAVVDLLDRIEVIAQAARALRGRIVVGSGPNTAVSWLMPIIAHYQLEFPNHEIELETGSSLEIVRNVMQGRVDIAMGGVAPGIISREEIVAHRLVMVPWGDDCWEIFGSVGMVCGLRTWPAGRPLRVFHYERWSVPSRLGGAQNFISDRLGVPVRLVHLRSLELVRGAIANDLGFGVLPGSAARFFDERQIARVCSLGEYGLLRLRLLHRRPRLLAEPVRTFLSYLLHSRPRPPTLLGEAPAERYHAVST
jgi:DNA-binding transcriptional LysR family regulator